MVLRNGILIRMRTKHIRIGNKFVCVEGVKPVEIEWTTRYITRSLSKKDFNVAYSSRWGYSLINTLKLKKIKNATPITRQTPCDASHSSLPFIQLSLPTPSRRLPFLSAACVLILPPNIFASGSGQTMLAPPATWIHVARVANIVWWLA